MSAAPTFVLVHGVAHGAWCWQDTAGQLAAAGHRCVAVDLPLTSLDDDAAAVVAVLDSLDGPSILVGHSYGGAVISRAANGRDDVAHLVYVAAIMLDGGVVFPEAMAEYPPTALASSLEVRDDGTFVVMADRAVECFYACCDPDDAAAATLRLRPTAFAVLALPLVDAPWQQVPSTYVVCAQDDAIHPQMQRAMAANAQPVVELDTDHSPFMSSRAEMLEVLLASA